MADTEHVLKVFLNSSQAVIRENNLGKKLTLVAQAVTDAGLFERCVLQLYAESYGQKIFGCSGLTPDEEAWLSVHDSWGLSEYNQITQMANPLGGIYYIPHERLKSFAPNMEEQLVMSNRPWRGEGFWHPDDMVFGLLISSDHEVMGNMTADDPYDHRIPTMSTAALLAPFLSMASATVEQELNRRRDILTGCFNGAFCLDETTRRLGTNQTVGLVFVDMDNLKQVNDHLGHGEGDRMIQQVGNQLRKLTATLPAKNPIACRLHGDEFALVFYLIADISAAYVEDCLRSNWVHILPDVSWGMAISAPGDDISSLLRRAEIAMYQQKRRKKSTP